MSEIDYNIVEGKIATLVDNLIDDKNQGANGTQDGTAQQPEDNDTDISTPKEQTDSAIKYPPIDADLFKDLSSKTNWWEENKEFLAFCIMGLLSAFVFCKGFCVLKLGNIPSGFLLFFFGVITFLIIGLVLLALLMKKASTMRHAEKNERDNKQLLFRQRMMEKVFELENRDIIVKKQKLEKEILKAEKDYLYLLDERQREVDYSRRMQLRNYEFVESYMKHVVDLAKVKEINNNIPKDNKQEK